MTDEIACTLSPADMAARGEELREISRAALTGRTREASGVRLVYRPSETTEAALGDLVRRERECCPFLDFRLDAHSERLTLEITGPSDAQEVLDAIFERSVPAEESDHGAI